jgi:putative membrane protein
MKTTQQPILLAALLTAGIVFTSCKQGENRDAEAATSDTVMTEAVDSANVSTEMSKDEAFFDEVAQINMEEIELGKLAQSRSTSKDVKDFGKMMVDGHTKAQNELTDLASKKNITLPDDVSNIGKQTASDLTAADAKMFDKMYIDKMVDGHKDAISKFESARDTTTDEETKAWIVKTLPDLKMHLDHAMMVQKKIN